MIILDQIRTELDNYVRRTGENPKVLYLGTVEYAVLDWLAKEFCIVKDPTVSTTVMKWNGMSVYKVDTPNHIGFGWIAPSPCG